MRDTVNRHFSSGGVVASNLSGLKIGLLMLLLEMIPTNAGRCRIIFVSGEMVPIQLKQAVPFKNRALCRVFQCKEKFGTQRP